MEIKKENCKGKFYKLFRNSFVSSRGDIVFKDSFALQKRKSCTGCTRCDWLDEIIREYPNIICKDFEDGAIYQIVLSNVSRDYETGHVDDFDVELRKEN
jgi:hypothetical protein